MVFNRFFFKTLIRVVLLLTSITGLATILFRQDLVFTQLILTGIIVIQTIELTSFVNKTNRDLSRFLDSVRDRDFSVNFSVNREMASFHHLHASFSGLIETLKELETENAAQYHFLDQLIDQISFGIITLDQDHHIELINQHALHLLDIPKVKNWQQLHNPNLAALNTMIEMGNTQNHLMESVVNSETRFFSVNVKQIKVREQLFTIIAFKDIKNEIQQKEIEAWHKLIRILTHEIMNSVTPLVSLTETIQFLLTSEGKVKTIKEVSQENLTDIHEAINTIYDRSTGILDFVQNYRKLTRIPKPVPEGVNAKEMIEGVIRLMTREIEKLDVALDIEVEPVTLMIDKNLIDQVLINLIKNALEAMKETSKPTLSVVQKTSPDFNTIIVEDNGPGIAKDKVDKIFIPFYTTKKDGSGIGLSLSRQIMNLHGGYINLQSSPGQTTFELIFAK